MTAPVLPLMLISLMLGLGTLQAEAIDIVDNHGGRVDLYDQRWAGLAASKPQVRVTGPCKSACTVLLKHVPRGKICVTPEASFGFHQALRPRDDEAALERLSRRHQGLDHQPRGTPAAANYPGVDAGARDIQVFQEVCVPRSTALRTRSSLRVGHQEAAARNNF